MSGNTAGSAPKSLGTLPYEVEGTLGRAGDADPATGLLVTGLPAIGLLVGGLLATGLPAMGLLAGGGV
jgi:hypothetical protein